MNRLDAIEARSQAHLRQFGYEADRDVIWLCGLVREAAGMLSEAADTDDELRLIEEDKSAGAPVLPCGPLAEDCIAWLDKLELGAE